MNLFYSFSNDYQLINQAEEYVGGKFDEQNTNVIEELCDWSEELSLNGEEFDTLKSRVDSLINEYNQINRQVNTIDTEDENILIDLSYRITIISAIAFFSMMQYDFSAECLIKSYKNTNDELWYYKRLFHSKTYVSLLEDINSYDPNSSNDNPSGVFGYSDNPIEIDSYLSIHNFSTTYKSNKWYLSDIYDYDSYNNSYPSVVDCLVEVFSRAEDRGLLHPYDIEIEIEAAHTTSCNAYGTGHVYGCYNNQCMLNIIEVIHYYNQTYSQTGHQLECAKCGFYKDYETHSFDYSYVSSTQHLVQCTGCSYSYRENHNFVLFPVTPYAQVVKKACDKCGYIFL